MVKRISQILLIIVSIISAQAGRDPLFDEIEFYLDQLKLNSGDILCPGDYSMAINSYASALKMWGEGDASRDIREELENSIFYVRKINDVIDSRTGLFENVITARKNAIEVSGDKFASKDWQLGEKAFASAVEYAEDGELASSRELLAEIESHYESAVRKAEQANSILFEWDVLKNAGANLAQILSPGSYSDGMKFINSALDNINEGGTKENLDENLAEANVFLTKAANSAGDFANKYPEIIEERTAAKTAGAENFAQKYWMAAENNLMSLGKNFESGDYEYVLSERPAAEDLYTLAKHEAVKARILGVPKHKIETALNYGAGDLAPITIKQSEDLYNEGTTFVDTDSYTEDEVQKVADESAAYADLAMRITEIIKLSNDDNPTWEKRILSWKTLSLAKPTETLLTAAKSVERDLAMDTDEDNENHSDHFAEVEDLFNEGEAVIKEAGGIMVISLSGLNYDPLEVSLSDENKYLVDKAIRAISLFPGAEITIVGHTDNPATKLYNKILSQRRAQEVMNYIMENSQVEANRIKIEGRGEEEPIAENTTFEGRAKNRRVDVVIDYL